MADLAIHVEHLSKRYRSGVREPYKSIRDVVVKKIEQHLNFLKGRPNSSEGNEKATFWALDDLCFEVNRGDVVGIIGPNGAGKSTLLKILSQITKPTKGYADIYGRVGSLLEVGTGFHPELTGKENIFLSGAILGMRKKEISRKFDEIVAFSGIARFLDLPVKRYSSGMYVRLAFAVAAHLEPEILLIDEVLAVGDADFQKKCLGKMSHLAGAGRTVLFVSHNMSAIKALCKQALYLKNGKLISLGPSEQIVEAYFGSEDTNLIIHKETKYIKWIGIENSESIRNLRIDQDIILWLKFRTGDVHLENVFLDCELYNKRGERVIHTKSKFISSGYKFRSKSDILFKYSIESPRLAPGEYSLSLYMYSHAGLLLWIDGIKACEISSKDPSGRNEYLDTIIAAVLPKYHLELVEG